MVEGVCDRHRGEEGARRSQVVGARGGLLHDGEGRGEGRQSQAVEACGDLLHDEEDHRIRVVEAWGDLPHGEACHREVAYHDAAVSYGAVACHGEAAADIYRLVEGDGGSEAFLGECDCLLVDRRYDSCRALGHGRVSSENDGA